MFMLCGKKDENMKENEGMKKKIYCKDRDLTFTTAKVHLHLIYVLYLNPNAILAQ
jgi:hypothetical protein